MASAAPLGVVPPSNPASNCVVPSQYASNSYQFIVDYCRAQEGIGPIALPSNYDQLSRAEQLLVVLNLERINRGEPPIVGLSAGLDALALQGATTNADPTFPTTGSFSGGSIWAGGYATVLGADSGWMYNDGPGGTNMDCTQTDTTGCWGHRDNILMNSLSDPLIGGGAYATTATYGPSYAFESLYGYPPTDLMFNWDSELPFFANPPAPEPLPPPTVTAVAPNLGAVAGGTQLTLTGTDLAATSAVDIGSNPTTDLSCQSDTTCTVVTTAGAPGPATVTVTTPGGVATDGSAFTYAIPTLTIESGAGQLTQADTAFPQPLATSVSLGSSALPQTPVTFTVTSGDAFFGGQQLSATVASDQAGLAQAPTLFAGPNAGTVTVAASGAGIASSELWTLTITPQPADLSALLVGPSFVHSRQRWVETARIFNAGPGRATALTVTLVLPRAVSVIAAPGAHHVGDKYVWAVPQVASGSQLAYRIVLVAAPHAHGVATVGLSVWARGARDPFPANNNVRARVTIQR